MSEISVQLVAFDFDHTLTRSPAALHCLALSPKSKSYIMTGRPNSERQTIIDWLRDKNIEPSIFEDILCYPEEYAMKDFGHELMHKIAIWKAGLCRDMGINIIFEDNMGVVKPIASISPKTLVMLLF